ncbi:KAP-like P-loop domain-containing protein [Pontibacter ummariensis]|uniref:KAP family P-loop domain-containing protein n=1 Tax=Pontibacter ummariensis TaxID=1610492 RepID=A0A239II76_9BACT|nr:P-loop NTPase fold protein [Pontibacter ummariensis]PRY09816.1 KAP-like P-loop domain-containing protein [Pontibacter ummariensis]SNS92104.1 KAP family P-loop domain-containing protein [Pontibacter ummariensis]
MLDIPIPNITAKVSTSTSPTQADMAIVSVDMLGTAGDLNHYVLSEYGYNTASLKNLSLGKGYALLHETGLKPILLVVTIASGDTLADLSKNLKNAVINSLSILRSKKVWLPLMGTGSGGLKLEESYNATTQVLNSISNKLLGKDIEFVLSIPPSNEGKSLYDKLNKRKIYEKLIGDEGLNEILRVRQLIKRSNRRFFLANPYSSREAKINRLLQERVRKAETELINVNQIEKVRELDIIFLISNDNTSTVNTTRIEAVGLVAEKLESEPSLKIEWKIRKLKLELTDLKSSNSVLTSLSTDEAVRVFSRIDLKLWEHLLTPPSPSRIAGLISDTDSGEDHMDISKDVMAFARVMAAKSFQPPLAVALLGKWGSGKSFFMRKLKDQISLLSAHHNHKTYCEGVAHIHFNAWSYTDANLWASLVSKIFEGLNEYISENTNSDKEKNEVERKLNHELTIAKEEIAALENQKNSITEQITSLSNRKEQLRNELKTNIRQIRNSSVWNAIRKVDEQYNAEDAIKASLEHNESYIKSIEQVEQIVPKSYWKNPSKAYAEMRSKRTFIREFFRAESLINNLLWLLLIMGLIISAPILITFLVNCLFDYDFSLSPTSLALLATAGAFIKQAELTYQRLHPVVASFWQVKEVYERTRNEAITKFEQEEKAIKLRIERDKAELTVINQQLQQANTLKADLEFKINNALATEALYSFIEKRCNSEDYKKHLGIVSTIRKDFEILNGLFSDHADEAEKNQEAEDFRKKFKKPLERIILYIDDLDRCQEENVVQVLEAVNLLMAYPLFVVVVGVDPRWVKNALLKKYCLQFTGNLNEETFKGLEVIESADYLEKIFQIPFHLKDGSDQSVKNMLKKLAQATPNVTTFPETSPEDSLSPANLSPTPTREPEIDTDEKEGPVAAQVKIVPIKDERPEALVITDKEIELMQDLSGIIGNNPRAIKRFVNIFRIIKAHEDFTYDFNNEERETLVIFFLLALPIGKYRLLSQPFEQFINQEENRDKTLYAFCDHQNKVVGLNDLKQELHVFLSDKQSFNALQQAPISSFNQHNLFIKRFTFHSL